MPVSKNRRKKNAPQDLGRGSGGKHEPLPETSLKELKELADQLEEVGGLQGLIAQLERSAGRPQDDDLDRAQEVMFEAWESDSTRQRIALAKKALDISSDCADAWSLLAEDAAKTLPECRDYYEKAVAAGERALGPETFEEDVGEFWGLIETRPYMRARAGLAGILIQLGESSAAADHYRDLLRLCPGDNMGLRYHLVPCLLELGDHAGLQSLLDDFAEEPSASWLYTHLLLKIRLGATDGEKLSALKAAMDINPYVPKELFRYGSVSRGVPFYAPGSPDEAQLYADLNFPCWRATKGALTWLAEITKGWKVPRWRG